MVNKPRKPHQPRIGIYAGAFDPVHAGHVAFALQAIRAGRLDQVVFMPERRPRHKPGVEHYAHRLAMVKRALALHPDLAVVEAVDRHFTVRRTLPLLEAVFPGAQLVLLMGSDAVATIPAWQYAERLFGQTELLVGIRSSHQRSEVEQAVASWPFVGPTSLTIVDSHAPDVSSSVIRHALRTNQPAEGLLESVRRYAAREWLYVSPALAIA